MKKTLIAAVAAFAGAAALTFTSCSNNQPKFTCFVQNVPTGGPPWWAKYTVNSESGTCDFLGTHQENGKIVTGEPLGIFLFGQGKGKLSISVQPYSLIGATTPDDGGNTVALGKFNDDPSSCTATDLSPAVGVIGDPNFAANPALGGWVPQAVVFNGSTCTWDDGGTALPDAGTIDCNFEADGGAGECGACTTDADCATGGVCFNGQCTGASCDPLTGTAGCTATVPGDSCQTTSADGGAIVPDGGGFCLPTLPAPGCPALTTTSTSSSSGSGSGSTSTTSSGSGSGSGSTTSSSGSGSGSGSGSTSSSGSGSGSGSGSTTSGASGSGSGSTGGSSGSSGTTGSAGCVADADCAAGEVCNASVDPAVCVPQVMATYQFSNVKFVQAGNIPGTQMSADLVYDQSALGATGTSCHAEIHVDGVWYSTTFLYPDAGYDLIVQTQDDGGANVLGEILWHCDTDSDCASYDFALPGANQQTGDPGGWECVTFLSTNQVPELMWDGGGGSVNRCVPKTGVPVGATE